VDTQSYVHVSDKLNITC